MLFVLIWGWQARSRRLGFVGPYTCPTCSWMGTFWLEAWERRFRLYYVPVTRWRIGQYSVVCRNCGTSRYLRREEGQRLLSEVTPLGAPDPLGPAPVTAGAVPHSEPPLADTEADEAAWQAYASGDKRS